MARGKVQRKLIENRSMRSSTYRKRIQGLKKKTYELATLCDVPTLLVSFGPDGQVETWPESSQEIKDILQKYNYMCGSKVSNSNKLDAEGFLQLEIERKRKELNRIALDSADKLQVLIKSLDSKLWEVNQRMQLLGDQHFTRKLEEQAPTLLESFEGDEYNRDIGFDPTIFETLPALENDGAVYKYPDIEFWERMANSTSVSDILKADGEEFEEGNSTDFFGLKGCFDDNQNSVGFDSVSPPTETIGSSTTFSHAGQANTFYQNDWVDSLYDQHMDFSSSLTPSPFRASFGGVHSQIAVDNIVQCPYKASTGYEQTSIADELLPEDEMFDNCQFMGYNDAQPCWNSSEFAHYTTHCRPGEICNDEMAGATSCNDVMIF